MSDSCESMDCSLLGSFVHMGFSRQEYWNRLPFPSLGDLPEPGIEPCSFCTGREILHHQSHQGRPTRLGSYKTSKDNCVILNITTRGQKNPCIQVSSLERPWNEGPVRPLSGQQVSQTLTSPTSYTLDAESPDLFTLFLVQIESL